MSATFDYLTLKKYTPERRIQCVKDLTDGEGARVADLGPSLPVPGRTLTALSATWKVKREHISTGPGAGSRRRQVRAELRATLGQKRRLRTLSWAPQSPTGCSARATAQVSGAEAGGCTLARSCRALMVARVLDMNL